jgi:6-phosphogluconolactonase
MIKTRVIFGGHLVIEKRRRPAGKFPMYMLLPLLCWCVLAPAQSSPASETLAVNKADDSRFVAPSNQSTFRHGESAHSAAAQSLPAGRVVVSAGAGSVYSYLADPTTGALTAAGPTHATDNGQSIVAIDKAGRFAFVAALSFSEVWAFTIDPASGRLSPVQGSPFPATTGIDGMTIDGSGHFLYMSEHAANGASAVEGFSIDQTSGALTAVPGSPYATATEATAIVSDPSGRFVYVAAGAFIAGYTINSSSGALTAMPGTQAQVNRYLDYQPTSLVIDPQSRFMYVAGFYYYDPASPTYYPGGIVAYTIDSTSGALTVVGTYAGSSLGGYRCCQQLAVDATGRFVYGTPQSTFTADSVMGFAVNQSTGALTAVPGSPFFLGALGGVTVASGTNYTPIGIATDGSGSFAYAVSSASKVVAFAINSTSGALTGVNSQPGGSVGVGVASPALSNATLVSLQITPQSAKIISRFEIYQQMTAQGVYSDNSVRFLTESVIWSSSSPVATISNQAGTKGLVAAGPSNGSIALTITATLGGVSGSTALTVGSPTPVSVSITPNSVSLPQGTGIQLKATLWYDDNEQQDAFDFAGWSSSNPSVAAFDGNLFLVTKAPGSTTIRATVGVLLTSGVVQLTGTAVVTVTPAVNPASLPQGDLVVAVTGYNETLTSFGISRLTGAVTQTSVAAPGKGLLFPALDPALRFFYVAQGQVLFAYTIDDSTGNLTKVAGAPWNLGAAPMGLTVDASGQFLYVAEPGQVEGYSISQTSGTVAPLPGSPFTLGTLTFGSQLPLGSAVVSDPSGRYLYVSGSTAVAGFNINSASGALTPIAGSPFSSKLPGSGPMAMDPQGRFLYNTRTNYTAATTSGIEAYAINAANGALTAVPGSPFLTSCFQIAMDGTGRFVYCTQPTSQPNPGFSQALVAGFVVDGASGLLTPINGSPFNTGPTICCNIPVDNTGIGAEGSGQFLYVSNVRHGLMAFVINPTTGVPTMVNAALTVAPLYGGPAVGSRLRNTVIPNAQGKIVPPASLSGAVNKVVPVPVNVTFHAGTSVDALSFTLQVYPGSAPPITTNVAFNVDAALPAPSIAFSNGPGTISVGWAGLSSPLSGTIHLGDVLVTAAPGAMAGQMYWVQITAANASLQSTWVPLASGAAGTFNVIGSYIVGDVFPNTSDNVGGFGDNTINTLDLIATLRAATGLPGFVPAKCSDRFDAMDAFPVDTATTLGGDGTINTLDLLVILKRATNLDTARPSRVSRGLSCPTSAPQETSPATRNIESREEPREAAGSLELVRTADGGVDVYLQARRDLHLSGLAIAFGASDSSAALSWTAGEGTAPSIVDSSLAGSLAAAWLNTLDLGAGGRMRLGHVRPGDAGVSVTVRGALANDQASGQDVKVMIVGDVRRR